MNEKADSPTALTEADLRPRVSNGGVMMRQGLPPQMAVARKTRFGLVEASRSALGYDDLLRPTMTPRPVRPQSRHHVQITLYRRFFAVAGSPVSHSFIPDHAGQVHTFTAEGQVYEAHRREVVVAVPEDAKVDTLRNVLRWGCKPAATATATEVLNLATAKERGFSVKQK